jgi:hypothetical protein
MTHLITLVDVEDDADLNTLKDETRKRVWSIDD